MGSSSKKRVIGYKYGATLHMGLGLAADQIYRIDIGGKTAWTGSIITNSSAYINQPNLFGGNSGEGGVEGTVDFMFGGEAQDQHGRLTSYLGKAIPAFRGTVTAVFSGFLCAMNWYPKQWDFYYRRIKAGWPNNSPWYPAKITISLSSGKIQAMNPAHILYESYVSNIWGSGETDSRMDAIAYKKVADTLYSEGFGLCFEWKATDDLKNLRNFVCEHIGAVLSTDPTTGKNTIRLIRDDYKLEELPVFDEDNGLLEIKFEVANNTEVPSQIIVKYIDAITFEERPAYANNPAIAQGQRGRNTETTEFPAIPTGELATRVAYRDLKAKTSGIKRCSVKLDRRAYDIVNGQPFRIKTKYRINNIDMVVRANRREEKFLTDGAITFNAVQDVFSLPKLSYNIVPPILVPEPIKSPVAIANNQLLEVPYRELTRLIDPANLQLLDNSTSFIFVLATAPNSACFSYDLISRVKGASLFKESDDTGVWCPTALISSDIGYTDKIIHIEEGKLLEDVEIGTAALINGEIVRIDKIDLANNQLTVGRGCIDTIPAEHKVGNTIWFYDGSESTDSIEYSQNNIIEVKLLSNTFRERLDANQAPVQNITIKGRQARPYPPANLKINNVAYPKVITNSTVNISWSSRNRLLQADKLIDTTSGDTGVENGVTYNLNAYLNNSLIASETGFTKQSYRLNLNSTHETILDLNGLADKTGRLWTSMGSVKFDKENYRVGNASLRLVDNAWLQTTDTRMFAFGLNDFTIEAWVKLNGTNGKDRMIVIDNFHNSYNVRSYQMIIGSNGCLNFYYYSGGGAYVRGVTNLADDTWHHIAVTREAGVLRLFVDGKLEKTENNKINFDAVTSITAIGAQVNSRNINYNFIGNIDQVRVYNGRSYYNANFTPSTSFYEISGSILGELKVELDSVRDGLSSFQKHSLVVKRD